MVALVATASLAVGVTAGIAFSSSAETTLYAPVATTLQPAVVQAPISQMAATNDMSVNTVEEAPVDEMVETVYAAPQAQGVNGWAAGIAAATGALVGAIAYKAKAAVQRVPTIAPVDVYTKGALPAATMLAAQPAWAMQTNSQAPIATALFIALPTFFLVILYVKTAGNPDIGSGGNNQEYYDRSKAAGIKRANMVVEMTGEGVEMYSKRRDQK